MIIFDMFFKLADRAQCKFNKESLEQAGTDISIGFVVVQSLAIELSDFFFNRLMKGCLDVVKYKSAVNILPTATCGISGKIGELEKAFNNEKASFDSPSFFVNFSKFSPGKSLFVC